MDPATHFMTGACLSRAGFNRLTGLATLVMTLAAEAPDIDVVADAGGPVYGFQHHRGITHTFVAMPVMAALVLAVAWLVHRWMRRGERAPAMPVHWGRLYLLAIVALLSHLLLDYTNTYGLRPFFPFNPRWYAWDIVFIVDPVLWAVLLLGLLMPPLFGLVGQEVGARRKRFRGRGWAVFALVAMAAVWGVRSVEHARALSMLRARLYRGEEATRFNANPFPVDPFRWDAVVETTDFFDVLGLDTRTGQWREAGSSRLFYKTAETPITLAAKHSYLGRVYLDWSKFPYVQQEPITGPNGETEYRVTFEDLRYLYPDLSVLHDRDRPNAPPPLGASVLLDATGRVLSMRMGGRVQR